MNSSHLAKDVIAPSQQCCYKPSFCIAFIITFCLISKMVLTFLECSLDAKKQKCPFVWLIHRVDVMEQMKMEVAGHELHHF